MFGKVIWDKLPKRVFENVEIIRVRQGQFNNSQKLQERFISKIIRIKRDYWLNTPIQQRLLKLLKLIYFNSRQLKNTTVNCARSITIIRVIILQILSRLC